MHGIGLGNDREKMNKKKKRKKNQDNFFLYMSLIEKGTNGWPGEVCPSVLALTFFVFFSTLHYTILPIAEGNRVKSAFCSSIE